MLRSIRTTTVISAMALLAAGAPGRTADLDLTNAEQQVRQVSLVATSGKARLHLITQEQRIVSFEFAGELTLKGDMGRPIAPQAWYAFCGETIVTMSKAMSDAELRMEVANPKRPLPCEYGKSTFVPVDRNPLPYATFDITVASGDKAAGTSPEASKADRTSGMSKTNPESGSRWTSLRLPALIFVVVVCLVLLGWFLWTWQAQHGQGRTPRPRVDVARIQQPVTSAEPSHAPAEPAPATGASGLDVRLSEMEAKLTRVDEQSRASRIETAELGKHLRALGFDDVINGLCSDIEKTKSQVEALQAKVLSAAVRTEVLELRRGLGEIRETLQKIETESRQKLQTGLSVLAERYWLPHPETGLLSSGERALIGQRMEEALTNFFRGSAPDKNILSARRESLQRLTAVIEDLRDELKRYFPDTTERMNPPLGEARHILDELDDTIAAATSQKLHLRFEADFSTSSASRETLSDAIAVGLGNQIVKLQLPIQYFDRRIQAVALTSSQAAADLIDLNAGDRSAGPLETKLQVLIGAAGIETIVPAQGEAFRAGEHTVVQTLPSADRRAANTVARLVTRGFRKDGRVFRKASVVLYE